MKKIKVSVIGCGTIANSAHIPAYMSNPEAEIVTFCDIIPERAKAAVEKYGCGKAVTDYHDVLADETIDAISICTPNHMHSEISIAALKAGKNVLCEKPCARVLGEALQMQKTQHETGKVLNIGVCNRFNTAVNLMKQRIDAGELGEIYHVYVSFRAHRAIPGLGGAFTTKAIAGGGALIDWGVHFFDIVMYCTGDPSTKSVSAKAYSKLGVDQDNYVYESMWAGPPTKGGTYDVDDFVTGFVKTSGPTITFNGAWAQNIGVDEMYIDFIGTKAGIRLQYGKDFTMWGTKDGKLIEQTPQFEAANMYGNEIADFIDCIHTGKTNAAHIDRAIITAKMMQAMYDSSDADKEIVL